MTFYEIEFPLAALNSDTVETALQELGASSITFVDRGDEPVLEPMPGEIRLWSDTLVRALFQDSSAHDPDQAASTGNSGAATGTMPTDTGNRATATSASASHLARNLHRLATLLGPHITQTARVKRVEDRDWERVWLTDWKSMRFGRRLWVCPTAAEGPADPEAIVVRLDPGLAFGTGTHPTTALCLQILESLPLSGHTLIDYGCGSGILGIAALRLGAARVTAVDIDPQALLATRSNAAINGVADRIDVRGIDMPATTTDNLATAGSAAAELGGLRPAYCVVANILAGPLIELAPTLTAACEPGGYLLLSGLLKTQAYEVKAAYTAVFDRVQVIERDDWCCIHARRAG
jgi:ribosomal protein L11 methyltransferase